MAVTAPESKLLLDGEWVETGYWLEVRAPFADGRLHLRVDLTDESSETQYHSVDDALVFVIYPSDEGRGLVRLEGRWTHAAELERL